MGQRPPTDKKLRREAAKLQKKNDKKELKKTLKNQMDEETEWFVYIMYLKLILFEKLLVGEETEWFMQVLYLKKIYFKM